MNNQIITIRHTDNLLPKSKSKKLVLIVLSTVIPPKILGKEMIIRVADICSKVVSKKNLFIATDNNKIANVVRREIYYVIMTSKKTVYDVSLGVGPVTFIQQH